MVQESPRCDTLLGGFMDSAKRDGGREATNPLETSYVAEAARTIDRTDLMERDILHQPASSDPATPSHSSPHGIDDADAPSHEAGERKRRVLVVDDFDDARELYCFALESAGYRPFEAENGAAAIERAQSAPPDAIILDISMPGMDGWEVVRRLRAHERTKHVPVIVLTGSGVRGQVLSREDGCAAYLMKPCSRLRAKALG
ncbi:response regulator, partial [bacterium]